MAYISLVIVFILAIMGTLFKSTRTDSSGKVIHAKYGLPVLSKTGKVVVSLLTISFLLSIFTTWRKAQADWSQAEADRVEKEKAAKYQGELKSNLEDVQRRNRTLEELSTELLKRSNLLSEEQREKFKSVLQEQVESGERVAAKISGATDLLRANIEASSQAINSKVEGSIGLLNNATTEIAAMARPIKGVFAYVVIYFPLDDPSVAGYKRRLDEAIQSYLSSPREAREQNRDLVVSWQDDNTPYGISIPSGSPLFPQEQSEKAAFEL
ncbi:MAG TPA: hypothetical protein VJT74_00510, partial [Pyrinomonadaceae bacterium]|nr:hypothetical protein [Pyrinomonadaceae bacterium]